ncbi:MAG: dephospho-CoA kinase [Thermomicrobiales bacterium]
MTTFDRYQIRITGPSGSGKTYMADRLAELGYPAIDADVIEGLGRFLDRDGNVHEYDHDGGTDWLETHFWSWDEQVLRAYLGSTERVIICGGAWNDKTMDHLFTRVFYLVVPKDEMLANLLRPDRFNPYGRTPEQQAFASTMIDRFYADIPETWVPLHARDVQDLIAEIEAYLGGRLVP